MRAKQYLIIGNCIAGINGAESIRKVDDRGKVTIVSDEDYPAYGRCLISNYLAGTHKEEDLWLKGDDFYRKNGIAILLGKKAAAVKPDDSQVVLNDGTKLKYDQLLIATGASSAPLGIEGEDKYGVFGFRTLKDAKGILKLLPKTDRVLVLGGGLIGLKAAYALKKRGVDVEVIIKSSHVLSQVVDTDSAQIVGRWLAENGLKIGTGLAPIKILGDKEVSGVLLDNGEKKECRIVVIGKGVNSNKDIVKETKIKAHWGIFTNSYLQTNADNIYTAGDVAETRDLISGESVTAALWTSAAEQGRIAGLNMAGEKRQYPGSIPANSVDFFGLPIISMGHVRGKKEPAEVITRSRPDRYQYKKMFLRGNCLVGAVLIGNIDNAGVYLALIRRQADISSVKDLLVEDRFDYAKVSHLLEQKSGFRESISIKGELIRTF